MKICHQCEAINKVDALFCCKCGAQLGACQDGSQQGGYQQPLYGYHQQSGYQPQPKQCESMGFGNAINVCLKQKYASFEGRATRAEYWYFYLFCILIIIGGGILGGILGAVISGGNSDVAIMLAVVGYAIISLSLICPMISVLVRRLHDTGRSGWWYWIAFIPYIGGIVILVFTLLESQQRDNKYGCHIV